MRALDWLLNLIQRIAEHTKFCMVCTAVVTAVVTLTESYIVFNFFVIKVIYLLLNFIC